MLGRFPSSEAAWVGAAQARRETRSAKKGRMSMAGFGVIGGRGGGAIGVRRIEPFERWFCEGAAFFAADNDDLWWEDRGLLTISTGGRASLVRATF